MPADRLYDTFTQLVSIDSPSLDERGVCDYLKTRLLSLGFEVREDDAAQKIGGTAGNLYGFLSGDSSREPILLCAHMDTVEPSHGKKCVLREDGRITSAGDTVLGADDLAGIAEILEATARLVEANETHRPIEVLFCVAEEIYARGAWHYDASNLKSKEAFVFDLSGAVGRAAIKAPSILSFEAVFRGKSAHAGAAFNEGVHAIAAAARAVAAIPMGQLDDDTTCNVGKIEGGGATNIVPDTCCINGEIRSFSHVKACHWAGEIKIIADTAAQNIGASCDFTVTEHIKAYETSENSPAALRFKRACDALGLPGELISTFGGSDNNHLVNAGFDGIVVANAMYHCHSTREYTSLRDMETIVNLIIQLLKL